MKTYSQAPYFDDFDDANNFHQILFKPGYAVQARELTQLQTILRGQIEKFGNHIFKHGSVVIPGNSYVDLAVPYIKIQPRYNTTEIRPSLFENKIVVGVNTGIRALVKRTVGSTSTDPVTFYLAYLSGSDSGVAFQDGEEIYIEGASGTRAVLQASGATGVGSLAFVNTGVYYINGSFVYVEGQSTVIGKYNSNPTCSVVLRIEETITDFVQDTTLLDPAQGSYNYAAPGADRVQISLTLEAVDINVASGSDYVELMRYVDGEVQSHARTPKYSELEKVLAQRTYDESGNYVVEGIVPTVREHFKTSTNGGVFTSGDINKLVVEVSPGKAYIGGHEVDKVGYTRIAIDKARTPNHIHTTSTSLRPNFGQNLIVTNLVGSPSVYNREVVELYNVDVSDASATKIGTARVISIDYLAGDAATANAMYALGVTDIVLDGTNTIEQLGGIRFGASGSAVALTRYRSPIQAGSFVVGETVSHTSGRAAIVHYWDNAQALLYVRKVSATTDTPRIGDLITGSTSNTSGSIESKSVVYSVGQQGLLFQLPKRTPYSLKNASTGAYDLNYTVQKELVLLTNSSGDASVSITSGEVINPIEVGSFVAVGPSGILSNSLFELNPTGTTLSLTSGPVNATVIVYASVTKTNVSPKTKTEVSRTITVAADRNIKLEHTDVIQLNSVIDSTGDITANFSLWSGQTDQAYMRGEITVLPGRPVPSGTVTINYTHYSHSVTGDFFCIDSYPVGILEKRATFQSPSGREYYLPACVDFRPSVGSDGEFTGPNSRRNDLPISGTLFSSSLQFYVPRIDALIVSATGNLEVLTGTPAESPQVPDVPVDRFALNLIFVPEYTKTITEVGVQRLDVSRFTMNDIQKIVNRVEQIEEYATLTALEMSTTAVEVVDASTGISRFKTGYMVENFDRPFSMARTTAEGYSATFVEGYLHAGLDHLICPLNVSVEDSTNYVVSGGYVTLPYTEEVFAQQTLSSRVTNINPFVVVRWDGIMSVTPPSDTWTEMRERPTIFESNTETIWVDQIIPCPPPPPPPAPPPPPPSPPSPPYYDPSPSYYDPPPALPPLPPTTHGGLYGTVLGRAGESAGVDYWVNEFKTSGDATHTVARMIGAAQGNFQKGTEQSFNEVVPTVTGGNTVLTSTTKYSYQGSNIVATTTSTNLKGVTTTTTKKVT